MWLVNVCFIHITTNSVSDSVNSMGSDDLKRGPKLRFANSGIEASCSVNRR